MYIKQGVTLWTLLNIFKQGTRYRFANLVSCSICSACNATLAQGAKGSRGQGLKLKVQALTEASQHAKD